MQHKLSALVVSLGLAVPSLAQAQELGNKGDAIFSADRLMGLAWTHRVTEDQPPGDVELDWADFSFGWRGAPDNSPFEVPRFAFDYLVIDHLSIGGSLGYATTSLDQPNVDAAMFEISPRVGYLYSFGKVVAIWPRGGFTYHTTSVDDGPSESGMALSLECMFTFSPTSHFAISVGPTFDFDMFGEVDPVVGPDFDRRYRTFGINAGILGWL
jgi:hypothetical protein